MLSRILRRLSRYVFAAGDASTGVRVMKMRTHEIHVVSWTGVGCAAGGTAAARQTRQPGRMVS